ncbi:hypothetical protein SAMN05216535_3435 [Stutzerimonas xanthomarina]|uniref:Uncharacterized protein n=2 Tax=Stutzerimonas xanthomarina TaxID=271420 RepID=A0A1M5SNE0_9GAMM|nr:hypothetical protein SAMN05216535_3435 [Stutzerimonas xanthomarina]SHH39994.1 hypothetical protein SAMN02744645_3584 [Stutzerimonas xanthomarina DSM 18231]
MGGLRVTPRLGARAAVRRVDVAFSNPPPRRTELNQRAQESGAFSGSGVKDAPSQFHLKLDES